MNDRLRNRIYHIKKEIKCLKRLKRQLIQRLVHNGDRFVEPCLEIPDVEPGTSIDERQHVEVRAHAKFVTHSRAKHNISRCRWHAPTHS